MCYTTATSPLESRVRPPHCLSLAFRSNVSQLMWGIQCACAVTSFSLYSMLRLGYRFGRMLCIIPWNVWIFWADFLYPCVLRGNTCWWKVYNSLLHNWVISNRTTGRCRDMLLHTTVNRFNLLYIFACCVASIHLNVAPPFQLQPTKWNFQEICEL
jgi:hypothetical protein